MDIRDCERGARERESADGGCESSTPEKRQSHSLSPLLRCGTHISGPRWFARRSRGDLRTSIERSQAASDGSAVGKPPRRVLALRRRRVAAHAVEEEREEAIGEGVGVPALAEQPTDPLLVAAALGQELERALALEVPPLAREHGGDVELLGNDAQV